jgi:Ni,Fe-hydrogenase III large subunit
MDIELFRIQAQTKGETVYEVDIAAFQIALFRMIRAIASDLQVQQWKVRVDRRMIGITAISSGKTKFVTIFLIDENNWAYGF